MMNNVSTKISKTRIVLWLALFVCLVGIFYFSSQPGDISLEKSNSSIMHIGKVIVSGFDDWNIVKKNEFVYSMTFFVRKAAHLLEYTILASLLLWLEHTYNKNLTHKKIAFAWAMSSLYAAFDEIHQYFIPGRACMFRDICIDSAGALIGTAFGILVLHIVSLCKH